MTEQMFRATQQFFGGLVAEEASSVRTPMAGCTLPSACDEIQRAVPVLPARTVLAWRRLSRAIVHACTARRRMIITVLTFATGSGRHEARGSMLRPARRAAANLDLWWSHGRSPGGVCQGFFKGDRAVDRQPIGHRNADRFLVLWTGTSRFGWAIPPPRRGAGTETWAGVVEITVPMTA